MTLKESQVPWGKRGCFLEPYIRLWSQGHRELNEGSGLSGTWVQDRRIASLPRWPLGHFASLKKWVLGINLGIDKSLVSWVWIV